MRLSIRLSCASGCAGDPPAYTAETTQLEFRLAQNSSCFSTSLPMSALGQSRHMQRERSRPLFPIKRPRRRGRYDATHFGHSLVAPDWARCKGPLPGVLRTTLANCPRFPEFLFQFVATVPTRLRTQASNPSRSASVIATGLLMRYFPSAYRIATVSGILAICLVAVLSTLRRPQSIRAKAMMPVGAAGYVTA